MKKKLNIDGITNELRGGSAFFPDYDKSDSPAPHLSSEAAPEQPAAPKMQPAETIVERPNAPSPVRPNGRRIITRNSFEIYEDQMDSLRKLSMNEKIEGRLGSMSAMVRDAIDSYLHEKNSNTK
jgi:hypothetical protein